MDIIVGRPGFDETTSSRPDLSQSVTPVTPSFAKASSVCGQPCTICIPSVMQGYDNTLCSLTMKRPGRPLVPQERHRRPHVNAIADLTSIDECTLIEESQLLVAIADDDDIKWTTDPFEMRPESGNTASPDKIIARLTNLLRLICQAKIASFTVKKLVRPKPCCGI